MYDTPRLFLDASPHFPSFWATDRRVGPADRRTAGPQGAGRGPDRRLGDRRTRSALRRA